MIIPTVHIAGPLQLALGGARQECTRCGAVLMEEIPEPREFAEDAAERYHIAAWTEGAEIVVQGDAVWRKGGPGDLTRRHETLLECA